VFLTGKIDAFGVEQKRDFFIRSAYYLQQELEVQSGASSSFQACFSEAWRRLWKLRIPNVEKKKKKIVEGLQ
jgi:hypothetical protein